MSHATEQKIIDSTKRALIKYVIVSDGAQQANTLLLDASSLAFALNANGYIMSSNVHQKNHYHFTIKRIFGQIGSADGYMRLQWRNSSNSAIVTFAHGSFDYDFQSMGDGAVIPNPEPNADMVGAGDILATSENFVAGDVATIILDIRKDARDYDQGQTADPYAFNRVV